MAFDRDADPLDFNGKINKPVDQDNRKYVPLYVRHWCKENCDKYGKCGWLRENCPYYDIPQWMKNEEKENEMSSM